jgi:predicted metal-dependent peptidase
MSGPFEAAKVALMLRYPFFAGVALRRPLREAVGLGTVGITNDGVIHYDPEWIERRTEPERLYVLCHECLHYLGLDGRRKGGRRSDVWNIACDAVINGLLDEAKIPGFVRGGVPGKTGKSKEQLYDELVEELPALDPQFRDLLGDGQGADGDGSGRVPCGEPVTEAQVQLELAEAMQMAKQAGNLSAGLERLAEQILAPRASWRDRLARWMTDVSQDNYSWARPNRRLPSLYLPSLRSRGAIDTVFFGIDTSGSISGARLARLVGEVKDILEDVRINNVVCVSCDTTVYEIEHLDFSRVRGGGGTDLRRLDDYVVEKQVAPSLAIWLTDGETPWPEYVEYPLVVLTTDKPAPETLAHSIKVAYES